MIQNFETSLRPLMKLIIEKIAPTSYNVNFFQLKQCAKFFADSQFTLFLHTWSKNQNKKTQNEARFYNIYFKARKLYVKEKTAVSIYKEFLKFFSPRWHYMKYVQF